MAAAGDDGGRARAALRGRGGERARATPRIRRRAALAPPRTARVLLLLVLHEDEHTSPHFCNATTLMDISHTEVLIISFHCKI